MYSFARDLSVCYISSEHGLALPRANDKPANLGGFETAIRISKTKLNVKFKIVDTASQSLLSRLSALKSENCDAVVGLVSSRDALLAARTLKKLKILALSSTATSDDLSEGLPYLKSLASSQTAMAKSLKLELKKRKIDNAIIVYQPEETFSDLYKDILKHVLTIDLEFFPLSSENTLPAAFYDKIVSRPKPVIFATYPTSSVSALGKIETLAKLHSELEMLPIFGNQTWLEPQGFQSRKEVEKILRNITVFSTWDFSISEKFIPALHNFFSEYHVPMDHDSAYDFDAMQFLIQCAERAGPSELVSEAIAGCFNRDKTFVGLTGEYTFRKNNAHPTRIDRPYPFRSSSYILNSSK